MNPWINYHHLLYFKVIAEEQSVSKAAEKLRLGQPTLSAQLKQFEETLGVVLFRREHKKLILTEQGQIALEYAQQIFKLGNEMYEALHDRLVPAKIHLRIGAIDSIPKHVIARISERANNLASCSISLTEGKVSDLLQSLLNHKIDLLVTNYLPAQNEVKDLNHKVYSRKPISLFGSKNFSKLKKDFPKSIQNQKFILPTYDSKIRYDIENWLKDHKMTIDIKSETQDISLQTLLSVQGQGLLPTSSENVKDEVVRKKLFFIGELKGLHEEILLVSAQRQYSNPLAERLLQEKW